MFDKLGQFVLCSTLYKVCRLSLTLGSTWATNICLVDDWCMVFLVMVSNFWVMHKYFNHGKGFLVGLLKMSRETLFGMGHFWWSIELLYLVANGYIYQRYQKLSHCLAVVIVTCVSFGAFSLLSDELHKNIFFNLYWDQSLRTHRFVHHSCWMHKGLILLNTLYMRWIDFFL